MGDWYENSQRPPKLSFTSRSEFRVLFRESRDLYGMLAKIENNGEEMD